MKIAIICFGFNGLNLRKQPWRYVYEIARGIRDNGHEVFIVTDQVPDQDTRIENTTVFGLKKLFSIFGGETPEVLRVMKKEEPDRVIMLLGMTSFLRTRFDVSGPVIGVLTSPIYSLRELIRNVGIGNLIRYHKYTAIHVVNSLVPRFLIRKWANMFKYIVVLSQRNKERLIKKGVPPEKVVVIPPGIDEEFLELPERETIERIRYEISPEGDPIIVYYTSPLTLRGTDTVVRALPKILEVKRVKLLILSRPDYRGVLKEEQKLMRIARKLKVEENLVLISKNLSPQEVKAYVGSADVVALPFKLVLSDVPLSILEAMALGKVVAGTDVDGIPEILEDRGLIVRANSPEDLATKIISVLEDGALRNELEEKAAEYVRNWPRWRDTVERVEELIT